MVAYCNAPTTDLYMEGSGSRSEPSFDNFSPVTIGEAIDLASSIFVLLSKSLIYLL